jgi:uncharacterized protein
MAAAGLARCWAGGATGECWPGYSDALAVRHAKNYICVATDGLAMALRFAWDAAKAAKNRTKHQISFETAARAFLDPFALSDQDRIEGGEYRWQTIGSVAGLAILVIAHAVYDEEDGTEIIHIISARRAERPERRRYEQEKYRQLRT